MKISNLSYKRGNNHIFNDVNIDLKSTRIGLLGENGAGKTTLLRNISALYKVQNGTIEIADHIRIDSKNNKNDVLNIKKNVAYLPQSFQYNDSLKTKDFIRYLLWLKKIDNTSLLQFSEIFDRFNINKHLDKKIKHLSGGELKCVFFVSMLCTKPKVLIFDEPTVGLDILNKNNFLELIKKIDREIVVIISSHILQDITEICDSVIILYNRTVYYSGRIDALMKQHKVTNIDSILLNLYTSK